MRYVVGIVKWLRQWVVAPLCVGSNPTIHPNFIIAMGYRQVVRQWILIPSCAGSNPATLANKRAKFILCPQYGDIAKW